MQTDGFTVYEIALSNPDRVGLMSNTSPTRAADKFEQTHGLKLLLFVNAKGEVEKGCYMAIETSTAAELDNVHYKKAGSLNGNVIYYNLNGTMSNGIAYVSGKAQHRISYLPESEVMALKGGDGSRMVQGCSSYYIETGYYYCVFTPYSENCGWQSTGYSSYTICDSNNTQLTLADENYGGGGGGGTSNEGGASQNSNVIPANPYMPGQDKNPQDPKKYMNCFNNISNDGASFKVIVQVQEPVPGMRINYGINGVGHTAITLVKKGNNGVTITQTIGFYPAANKFSGPSKIVDNAKAGEEGNVDFTISMEFDLGSNSDAFGKIVDGVANPPHEYQLFVMNCTAFVVGACSLGGINLPSALNGVAGFYDPLNLVQAMTPSGLGASMRDLKANGDNRVKINPSSTVSKGPCN